MQNARSYVIAYTRPVNGKDEDTYVAVSKEDAYDKASKSTNLPKEFLNIVMIIS